MPDLLPSDICGTKIYNQKTGDFQLTEGPVMTNFLLADEICRMKDEEGTFLHKNFTFVMWQEELVWQSRWTACRRGLFRLEPPADPVVFVP